MARLTIRIDLGDESALGPGKARLLELVEQKGSIRSAARAMDMSYRRAWLLIKDIEGTMGAPVVSVATGGMKGGGASLTTLGREVIDRYRAIEAHAARSVAVELEALSEIAQSGASVPRRRRKKSIVGARRKSARSR